MANRPPSWLEINLDRLSANIRSIRTHIGPNVGLCCVVKSDGYGLGAAPIAAHLQQQGVDLLAVFTAEQARELLRLGIETPILVFMPLHSISASDPLCRALRAGRLHCVAHDERHLNDLIRIAESLGCVMPVHIEVDTGMSRGGMTPEVAKLVMARVFEHPSTRAAGVFSHFACSDSSDETTRGQYADFDSLMSQIQTNDDTERPVTRHMANTDAAFAGSRDYHLDMIRIGLAWVGYAHGRRVEHNDASNEPSTDTKPPQPRLLPIVRWLSSIVHVKWIEPGTPVGYGQTWRAKRRTRVGLIPVGYADGYPISLSSRAVVRVLAHDVNDRRSNNTERAGHEVLGEAPVIGRVSMDQFTVDLTGLPEAASNVGTVVEILADDPAAPNDLLGLAALGETIPYDILTKISHRIQRDYLVGEDADSSTDCAGETSPPHPVVSPSG